jgi:hypothetical protein
MEESSTFGTEGSDNQMYIIDLRRTVSEAGSLDDMLIEMQGIWETIYDQMDADETLWVIAPNDYQDGRLWPVAMAVADHAQDVSNFILKNTITLHTWNDRGADMESAYDEILFFVKNKREYQFHKDNIRVAHVYEGHEWGGEREEGNSAYHDTKVRRYNPDGKDPGNVWLEEDRTQTDDQSVDETQELSIQEAVRRCILVGSNEGETVYLVDGESDLSNTITDEDRVAEVLDGSALREEVPN